MFAARFFANRFFAPSYFGNGGEDIPEEVLSDDIYWKRVVGARLVGGG